MGLWEGGGGGGGIYLVVFKWFKFEWNFKLEVRSIIGFILKVF